MTIEINWCAPMYGDSRWVGVPPERAPTIPYFVELFETCRAAGFHSLLMGAGFTQTMEAFTTAAAVLPQTETVKAMVAVRPGFFHPCVLAKLAATVDHMSDGRLLLNVVTGGNPAELATYGDYLDHDTRYDRTEEFVEIARRLWTSEEPIDHEGRFFRFERAALSLKPVSPGGPTIYFGGASEPATQVAARQADVYLMWGEPVAQIAERIADVREKAGAHDRTLRFGLRVNVVARETEAAAWDAAREIVSRADPEVAGSLSTWFATMDSVGQRRIVDLQEQGEVLDRHLWTGMGRLRVGAGTALVGGYNQVVARLLEYVDAGVDTFILAGYPHLEEAVRAGETLVPALRSARVA